MKSSKLVAAKRGRVLLVRRKRDGLWMFPGGRKRAQESDKNCLRREIKEELPKLKLGRLRLWKEVKAKNRRLGWKMSDAIFVTAKASGQLTIGDRKESSNMDHGSKLNGTVFGMNNWPDHLRDHAAIYRELAERTDDPIVKTELLALVSVCEEIADNIEDHLTGGDDHTQCGPPPKLS